MKFYEEKIEINIDFLINLLKSWSAYINYMKKKNEKDFDPLVVLKSEFEEKLKEQNNNKENFDITKIKFDYYNFYFMIALNN